jgi:hypothetical protein
MPHGGGYVSVTKNPRHFDESTAKGTARRLRDIVDASGVDWLLHSAR